MRHDYRLEGAVNGQPVLGVGSGILDFENGISEMEVDFRELPEEWDPRAIVLNCCDRSTVMAAAPTKGAVSLYRSSGGLVTMGRDLPAGRRRAIMRHLSDGSVAVQTSASSVTDLRGSTPFDNSRIESGSSNLRPGRNGIASIAPFKGIMMQAGPRLITLMTTYEAALEDGTTITGTSYYPHYLPEQQVELSHPQVLHVDNIEQKLEGTHLWVRVTSRLTPLPLV